MHAQEIESLTFVIDSQTAKPSDRTSTASQQINHQDHQRHNQQQVDQAAGNVKTKTEKPKNQKHNKNRPKHIYSPLLLKFSLTLTTRRFPTTFRTPNKIGRIAV
jgi:hypothetical protein